MKAQNKGITLVALVITIIIILILAGITIGLTIGNDGIIRKAILAKKEYQNAQNLENNILLGYQNEINNIEKIDKIDDNNSNPEINNTSLANLENYKLIYNKEVNWYNDSYTLEKDYAFIIIVVSSIGWNGGTENAVAGLAIENSEKQLIKIMDNYAHAYAAGQYKSATTVGYIVNPTVGTIIKTTAPYYGGVQIYALGEE